MVQLEVAVGLQILHGDVILLLSGEPHRIGQDVTNILFVAAETQQFGEIGRRNDCGKILLLVAFEQLARQFEMRHFHFVMLGIDLTNARVGLILGHRGIEVALGILVRHPTHQPTHIGVFEAFVLRNVLFLDHSDLGIHLAAVVVGIKTAHVHIKVHGLLFGGGDDIAHQNGERFGLFGVHRIAHVVGAVAVLGNGGTARCDLGVSAHQSLGVYAIVHFEQVGKAVQVIEVFQQSKVEGVDIVLVGLALRQNGRKIHRQLLVAYCGLENGFVGGFQRGQTFLLLLLLLAHDGNGAANVVIGGMPCELVQKPVGLEFGAVHQNLTYLGVGRRLVFVVGLGRQTLPVHKVFVDGFAFGFQWIHISHSFANSVGLRRAR